MRDDSERLRDILEAIERIERYAAGGTAALEYLLSEIAGQKWYEVDARKKLPFPGKRMHSIESLFLNEERPS